MDTPLILVAASVIWLIKINTNIIKYLASFSILIGLTFAHRTLYCSKN